MTPTQSPRPQCCSLTIRLHGRSFLAWVSNNSTSGKQGRQLGELRTLLSLHHAYPVCHFFRCISSRSRIVPHTPKVWRRTH